MSNCYWTFGLRCVLYTVAQQSGVLQATGLTWTRAAYTAEPRFSHTPSATTLYTSRGRLRRLLVLEQPGTLSHRAVGDPSVLLGKQVVAVGGGGLSAIAPLARHRHGCVGGRPLVIGISKSPSEAPHIPLGPVGNF